MSQGKPPLTMMPEVLPRPTQVDAPGAGSVRARAVARLKTLAAAGATSVIASCGYGVVDPLPQPSCFESPKPTVTAGYLSARADGGTVEDGGRLVEVKLAFTNIGVTVGEIEAKTSAGPTLTVVEKQVSANEIRVVVSVPKGTANMTVNVQATCAAASRALQIYLQLGPSSVTASAF